MYRGRTKGKRFMAYKDKKKEKAFLRRYRKTEKFKNYQRTYYVKNKEKILANHRRWYHRNSHKCLLKWRVKVYGITEDIFRQMMKAQKNLCPICKEKCTENSFCIDHCHTTNLVRGLLCGHCNKMLGNSKDNIQIFKNAIKYLTGLNHGRTKNIGKKKTKKKTYKGVGHEKATTTIY